jgi:2-keto-4-pentenoate hydratase/2-oxohepta-3-ene-1,7-dioic acid hydratase in catechol pathway
MRFITYTADGVEGVGVKDGSGYRGLPAAVLGGGLLAFLDGRLEELAAVLADAPALGEHTLEPPVPRPRKILCVGVNYRSHAQESGFEAPEFPEVFARFGNCLVAGGRPLVRPRVSNLLDYEAELAFVIGAGGRHIPEADALSHVAGYACFNDGSVRDYQIRTQQWTMGKVFDGTGGFGPELVTPDELPPGASGLRIQFALNGETLQDASTADLIFDVPRLVAILSEAMTLEPGDVVVTGTPDGVGALRDPQIWLRPGDVCTVEIEGVGRLTNPVVQEGGA